MRIDYQIGKHVFRKSSESAHIAAQWQRVVSASHDLRLDALSRLRLALTSVDYVTSYELPFRLLLVRAPQDVAHLQDSLAIHSRATKSTVRVAVLSTALRGM